MQEVFMNAFADELEKLSAPSFRSLGLKDPKLRSYAAKDIRRLRKRDPVAGRKEVFESKSVLGQLEAPVRNKAFANIGEGFKAGGGKEPNPSVALKNMSKRQRGQLTDLKNAN